MNATEIGRVAHTTDLSSESESAYHHALRLAVAAGSALDLVHVDEDAHVMVEEVFPSPEETLGEWQLEGASSLGEVHRLAAYGKEPVEPILAYLDEYGPDLLVVATHQRHGLARWVRRPVAQKVQRHRSIPTLFLPVGEEGFVSASTGRVVLERILVPLDWLPSGQPAVDAALGLADLLGAHPLELTLLHVGASSQGFPSVSLPQYDGLEVMRSQHEGDVVEQVAGKAEELSADLVVMVTEGRHGLLEALRGSTTEQVLQELHCPLLVMPDPNPPGMPPEV
ncbi:MAG: universal stress protein [Holophagales bacterium]|nr:universal stress protein [Holophagales bacterium]